MAHKSLNIIVIVLSLFFTLISFSLAEQGGIAVYWGQNNGDGELIDTCDPKRYKIVILSFLNKFGGGRKEDWNFAGHCDHGARKKCTELEKEINECQKRGIKVLLSIGGAKDYSDYSISSADNAKEVAYYLYTNFLSGQYGPLGSVYLDGIDFDIEYTEDHWDDLVKELDALRKTKRHFYLAASPECPIPVVHIGKAIATGLFDYIFVQFYNNPCGYHGDSKQFLAHWDEWAKLVRSNNSLFLGLPAAPISITGFIEPDTLKDILSHVKTTPNYGGVALWDRELDVHNNYSGKILPYVFKSDLFNSVTSVSDAIYQCVSASLYHALQT